MKKNKTKSTMIAFVQLFLVLVTGPVSAQSINQFSIIGDGGFAGIVGNYPTTSLFSWMFHIFPGNTTGHSWTLGPGTDGGILFDQAQDVGEMMGIRFMFNQQTTFFSVGSGLAINGSEVVNMDNLRMWQASNVIDVGSGSGFDTLVPKVSDIGLLLPGENGWMMNTDNSYHLIYNTRGTCADCKLMLHLYGNIVAPIPPAVLLFLSGITLIARVGIKYRPRIYQA